MLAVLTLLTRPSIKRCTSLVGRMRDADGGPNSRSGRDRQCTRSPFSAAFMTVTMIKTLCVYRRVDDTYVCTPTTSCSPRGIGDRCYWRHAARSARLERIYRVRRSMCVRDSISLGADTTHYLRVQESNIKSSCSRMPVVRRSSPSRQRSSPAALRVAAVVSRCDLDADR